MNDKRGLTILLMLVFAGVLAYFVFAEGLTLSGFDSLEMNRTIFDASPASGSNNSGNINLSVMVNSTANIANVSFMWQLISNNSFMRNITYHNTSAYAGYANQSVFGNHSGKYNFNTSSLNVTDGLPDGIYNLSIYYCNISTEASAMSCAVNSTFRTRITIDNTIPAVSAVANGNAYNLSSYNVTFNASIKDLTIQTAPGVIAPGLVVFHFDNATGNDFNVTPVNQSGYWSYFLNVSALHSGDHVVKIFANDTASRGGNNSNITQTITFSINNPHAVTWVDTTVRYYNITSMLTPYLNVSVTNATVKPAGDAGARISRVIFMFNNATGDNAFNVTNGTVDGGKFWNISYNMSSLRSGRHTVTAFVNDSLNNINQTESIYFEVNNPHNVTWDATYTDLSGVNGRIARQNFTAKNTTIYFNVSIINASVKPDGASPRLDKVIFMFDNATGNDFNLSNGSVLVKVGNAFFANVSYNLSALQEGNNSITIFVNDTLGNVNTTEKIYFFVDKTAPSVTVSCTPSAATVGNTVTCSCSAAEADGNSSGIKTSARFSGSSSSTESTTAAGTSGTSQTCYAEDFAGNTGTGTGSWTVTAASSGGSGGGGSGGGTSSGVTGTFAKEVWTSINAGETAKVEVTNGAIGVTEVSFSVADTTYGAWLKVEKKDSLPSEVQSFSGKVYKNVEITESNVKKALTGTAKIDFKVTKVWLSENGLGKTDLAMHRYADGKWNELKTTVGEDDGTYQYYSAETPGFSYFVIGQKTGTVAGKVAEKAAAETAAGEEAAGEEAAAGGEAAAGEEVLAGAGKGIWTWVIVVLVIIALVAIAFWLKKR